MGSWEPRRGAGRDGRWGRASMEKGTGGGREEGKDIKDFRDAKDGGRTRTSRLLAGAGLGGLDLVDPHPPLPLPHALTPARERGSYSVPISRNGCHLPATYSGVAVRGALREGAAGVIRQAEPIRSPT